MTEAGTRRAMTRKRSRAIYCTLAERAAIRARAAAAGKPVSRHILDLAFAEAAGSHGSTLTAEEMGELLDGFRALVVFVRALKEGTPVGGGSGTGRRGGVPVGAETRRSVTGCRRSRCACRSRRRTRSGQPSISRRGGGACRYRSTSSGSRCRTASSRARVPIRCRRSPAWNSVRCSTRCGIYVHCFRMRKAMAPPCPACGNGLQPCSASEHWVSRVRGDGEEIRSAPESDKRPPRPPPAAPLAAENPEGSGEDGAGATPDPKLPRQGALF